MGRQPTGSRHTLRRSVFASGLVVTLLLVAVPVQAHDWFHSHQTNFSGTSARYRATSDSDANNDRAAPWSADGSWAELQLRTCDICNNIAWKSATCGPVNDQCEYVATLYTQWVARDSSFYLMTTYCGYDDTGGGRHTTPQDFGWFIQPCAGWGLEVHQHIVWV